MCRCHISLDHLRHVMPSRPGVVHLLGLRGCSSYKKMTQSRLTAGPADCWMQVLCLQHLILV